MNAYQQLVKEYQDKTSEAANDEWDLRRHFLRKAGLKSRAIARWRLRQQDGLSEDAWWTSLRQAMNERKPHE